MRCERQQLGIFLVIAAMIAIFVIQQFLPLQSKLRAMQQVKSAQLSAETKIEEQVKSLPALRRQLDQLQAKVGNYELKIPKDRNLGSFLKEIADIMDRHHLADPAVEPDSDVQADGLMCIPVRIQCRGTLRQMFDFFKSLQTMNRLFRIEEVQLKNDADLKGLITMAAKGIIYYEAPTSHGDSRP